MTKKCMVDKLLMKGLCLKVEDGGRKLKSMNDVQEDSKVSAACYMAY